MQLKTIRQRGWRERNEEKRKREVERSSRVAAVFDSEANIDNGSFGDMHGPPGLNHCCSRTIGDRGREIKEG